jgi:tetratricopeptide (TPR) repeat protein
VRRLFNQLLWTVREFVKQRDDLLMVVPCQDTDVPLLMMALRDLDRESGADLFLLFAEDFVASDSFVDGMATRLREEHRLTNGAIENEAKLPLLPRDFVEPGLPASERLQTGVHYGHSLIDSRRGQRLVWGMGPGAIANAPDYLELLAHLLPRPDIRPWMRGTRIIARVSADFELDNSPLASGRRLRVCPFTIPPDAHEKELLACAADPKMPLGERMQAEVQLGYIDYAHGRLSQAMERFLNSLAFFQWAGVPVMEGLIICGLGDIARRQQNLEEAQHWYECALVPASKDANPMLMATIVQHLAAIGFQQQRYEEAEERYSELVTLKRAMLDEDGLVEALEWQGLSQERQQTYGRAVACWYEGALICKTFEMTDRLPRLLGLLRSGYQALDMRDELDAFAAEWNL